MCVWDWCSILPAHITAEYGSCTVLPAHVSKNSRRTEGHARLSFYGSVTNYRLVCEIRVASLSPISLGKALCGVQHWSPAAEKLTGAAILKCIPGTSMLLSASGQYVVYKLEGPLSSYWKRKDFIFNQALNCNETKIYVQLLATWPLFMLYVEQDKVVGRWCVRNQSYVVWHMCISHKVFHHPVVFYFRFFSILNYSLLLQPEQCSSQCYVWVGL